MVSIQIDAMRVETLREMARDGHTPSEMCATIQDWYGPSCHILEIIRYFREAFSLTIAEASPLAGCSGGYPGDTGREIVDPLLLDSLLLPAINARALSWGGCPAEQQNKSNP